MSPYLLYLQSSREQLAIAEFAKSLLAIPKQLAVNAAQDSTDLVAKLRAYHNTSQLKAEHRDLKWWAMLNSAKNCLASCELNFAGQNTFKCMKGTWYLYDYVILGNT